MAEHRPPVADAEERARWTHGHGRAAVDPDPELSVRGILWTAGGIAAVTAVAMVLMVWLAGGLGDYVAGREPAPTPAELQRREQVRRAGEERRAAEVVPRPALALPADYEVPPEPRLELEPGFNLEQLRAAEDRLLGEWGWADEEARRVRIPIETAIDLAAAGRLPGVPRGAAGAGGAAAGPSPAAERAAEELLEEAGQAVIGAPAEVDEPERETPEEETDAPH